MNFLWKTARQSKAVGKGGLHYAPFWEVEISALALNLIVAHKFGMDDIRLWCAPESRTFPL